MITFHVLYSASDDVLDQVEYLVLMILRHFSHFVRERLNDGE